MVKVCPSDLCKHENLDKNNYCEKCGIDLSQDKTEVKGRDELFRLFKSIDSPKTFTGEQKKMFENLSREDFDWAIEKNVGKIYMLLINAYADNLKEINKLESNAKEAKVTDIEKEKLKVLKKNALKIV